MLVISSEGIRVLDLATREIMHNVIIKVCVWDCLRGFYQGVCFVLFCVVHKGASEHGVVLCFYGVYEACTSCGRVLAFWVWCSLRSGDFCLFV